MATVAPRVGARQQSAQAGKTGEKGTMAPQREFDPSWGVEKAAARGGEGPQDVLSEAVQAPLMAQKGLALTPAARL